MASLAVSRRRPPTSKGEPPWWGEGIAPHKRWPGVTIEIRASWSKATKRWETPDGRFYFDRAAADKVCDFFPTFLSHHIGEFSGEPFKPLDYQRVLLRAVMGWKQAADGLRRFRKVLLFVAKGNGKSPLGSGLGLYLTLCDDEAGAEVFAVASDKEQGKVVHDSAKVMVESSSDLMELCEVYRDSIYEPRSRSFYKVVSADVAGKHGVRPHGLILDELEAQPNRDLLEVFERSMVKRRQPLTLMMGHAGDDDEGICFEEYEYAKRVLKGHIEDDAYFPMVFEIGEKDNWTDPKVWPKANPALGITVKEDAIASACKAAQNEPRKRNDFLRYAMNRWVGQATAWIPIEWWDACPQALPDASVLSKLTATAGLDMAQKIDLTAFVVTLRQPIEGPPVRVELPAQAEGPAQEKREVTLNFRIIVIPFFWLPEETVKDREREGMHSFRAWSEAGLLTITEGGSIDYDRVYKDIMGKILPRFPLLKQGQVGYDPAFATDIANRLRDKGGMITGEVLQNYTYMTEPCHVFEALVKDKRIVHDGNRLLRWNVESVAVKRDDAGRLRPVKPRRSSKKIDGLVASLMGLRGLLGAPDRRERSMEVLVCG